MASSTNKSNKVTKFIKRHLMWQDIIVGLIILAAISYFVVLAFDNMPSSGNGVDNATVRVVAKKVVSDNLKSPSSAKFSSLSVTNNSNGNYTVTGKVEAENSFGAKINNSFSVDLNIKSDKSFTYSNLIIE